MLLTELSLKALRAKEKQYPARRVKQIAGQVFQYGIAIEVHERDATAANPAWQGKGQDMKIRPAVKSDISQIAKIYVASWQSTYRGILGDDYLDAMEVEAAEAKWSGYLEKPDHFAFVACANDENETDERPIAGFAAGMKNSEVWPDSGLLDSLHIAPDFRGRGIGKKLMAAFAAELRRRGIEGMAITVIEGNDNAQAIYRHLGAQVVGRRKSFYGGNVDEVVLFWRHVSVLCSNL